jgi:hypothetical protein
MGVSQRHSLGTPLLWAIHWWRNSLGYCLFGPWGVGCIRAERFWHRSLARLWEVPLRTTFRGGGVSTLICKPFRYFRFLLGTHQTNSKLGHGTQYLQPHNLWLSSFMFQIVRSAQSLLERSSYYSMLAHPCGRTCSSTPLAGASGQRWIGLEPHCVWVSRNGRF